MANEKNLKLCGYKLSREEVKKGGINGVKSHVAVVVNSINDHTEYRAELTYKP